MLTESAPAVPDARPRFTYQPALDGIRALAVSAVVLYHLDIPWMRGGFMGVDTFFVLSGFLITSLLLEERTRRGTTALGAFWSRRARRLLPAVFVLIAVVTWYASTVVPTWGLDELRGDALAGTLYVANWHFITSGFSYFDLFTAPSPFQHLWSLAIEEQFYLVWPLVFVLVASRTRRPVRNLFVVCIAGAALSQIVMVALYDADNVTRAYFATPARLNTILLGCALAALMAARPKLARRLPPGLLTAAAAGALVLCVLAWSRGQPSRLFFLGGDSLFAVVVVILLFSLQGARTPVHAALGWRPLVWLGGISYALYLWHWPVILYLDGDRTGLSGTTLDVVRVAVAVAIAAASSRWLEWPVRRSKRPVLPWAITATVLVVTVVLVTTAGATDPPNFAVLNGGKRCPAWGQTEIGEATRTIERRGVPAVPQLQGKNITVIGDSRACSLIVGFDAAAPLIGAEVGNGSVLGCGVVAERFDVSGLIPAVWRDKCPGAFRRAFADVRDRADVIVWWSAWEGEDLMVGDRVLKPGTAEHDELLRRRMEDWLADEVPAGVPVAITLVPQPIQGGPNGGRNIAAEQHPKQLNRVFREFAAAHPDRVTLLDLDHFLCPDGSPCDPVRNGIEVRPDGTHLSPEGAGLVADWMLPQLAAVVRP